MNRIYIIGVISMLSIGMAQAQKNGISVKISDDANTTTEQARFRITQGATKTITFEDGKAVMSVGEDNTPVCVLPMEANQRMTINYVDYNAAASTGDIDFREIQTSAVQANGYGTFYSAFQLRLPAYTDHLVDAYVPYLSNGYLKMNSKSKVKGTTIIPAGQGIVLKNNTGSASSIVFEYVETDEPSVLYSAFTGSTCSIPAPTGDAAVFTLQKNNNAYIVTKYTGQVLGAHKAFLEYNTTNGSKLYFDFSEESDGIEDVSSLDESEGGAAYNLAGQRVSENAKGIIIKNGKKQINK